MLSRISNLAFVFFGKNILKDEVAFMILTSQMFPTFPCSKKSGHAETPIVVRLMRI